MKLRIALLPLLFLILATSGAEARRRRSLGGERYSANGTFGLGLELGAPFGLNGKYFLSEDGALNFGLGADGYYYRDRDGIHIYLDYLWHPVSLANPPQFKLPLYVGIGARLWSFDNRDDKDDGVAFGIRVPFGIAFDLNNLPLDFFLQLTPVLDFYSGYRDNVGFWFEASFGVRFWFD